MSKEEHMTKIPQGKYLTQLEIDLTSELAELDRKILGFRQILSFSSNPSICFHLAKQYDLHFGLKTEDNE